MVDALRELARPDEEGRSVRFESHRPVAWKTGTSFGFRDAWAVGATPHYVIGVWVGNADGEGRPDLIGSRAAAPILFDVLRELSQRPTDGPEWFEPAADELELARTCAVSGLLAGADCPVREETVPVAGVRGHQCAYHERLLVDAASGERVTLDCAVGTTRFDTAFVLPTVQAYYYARSHPQYGGRPVWSADCADYAEAERLRVVRPLPGGTLRPGRNWRGEREPIVVEVAPSGERTQPLHWHVNGRYLGRTGEEHRMALTLPAGAHELVVKDERGNRVYYRLKVQ